MCRQTCEFCISKGNDFTYNKGIEGEGMRYEENCQCFIKCDDGCRHEWGHCLCFGRD
jgi:hypothetical protein